jgi:NitT/TauT family transport system permease protein/taurine transport system permease protein
VSQKRSRARASALILPPDRLRFLVVIGIVCVWEALPHLGLVPPVLLAPLSATIVAGIYDAPAFASSLATTCAEVAVGLAIAWLGGAFLGLILGSIRILRETLLPLASSVYAAPLVIIYPVLTAWVGIGPESKVLFAGLYGLFPMLLATAAGVQTVDKRLVVAARSMGATRAQVLLQVMVPAALPAIVSGLRLGAALVAIGVVVAEMLASTAGIGFLITQNRTMFKTAHVYFGILLVLVLAGTLDQLVGFIERRIRGAHIRKALEL